MPVNSKRKGSRGEREAANYLKSIGFEDARRTQQYNGLGESDVVCPESLPNVHIEVKYGYDRRNFNLGTQLWLDACQQAADKSDDWLWCVLWRPKSVTYWRMTFYSNPHRVNVTVSGDFAIKESLAAMQELADNMNALEATIRDEQP